ncbi:MAG: hypothetical protein F6J93_01245 [Oscillatoria sp. SIO1A7]|nr:hypothetical protein [Oscillatoria sp. SIO1A7]
MRKCPRRRRFRDSGNSGLGNSGDRSWDSSALFAISIKYGGSPRWHRTYSRTHRLLIEFGAKSFQRSAVSGQRSAFRFQLSAFRRPPIALSSGLSALKL